MPLSASTKLRIKAWFNAYDQPRPDWPIWKAPEGLSQEAEAWVEEGGAIRRLLEEELGQPVDFKT